MSTTLGIYSKMLSIATLSKESNSKQESLKYGNNNEFLYFDKKYLVFEIPFKTNVKTDYTNPLINFEITYLDNSSKPKTIRAYDGSKQLDEWDSNLIRVSINKQGNYGVFQAILEAPKDCTKLATVYLKMTKKAVFNTYDPTHILYYLEGDKSYTAEANAWDNTYNFELVTSLTCGERGISSSGKYQGKKRIQTSPKVSCKNNTIEIYGGGNSNKDFSDSYFSSAIKIKIPDMYFLEEKIGFKKIQINSGENGENPIYSEEAGTGLEYLNECKFSISNYENLLNNDSIKFTVTGELPTDKYPILNSGYNNFSSDKNLKWIGTNNIFSEVSDFSSSELDYVKQLKKEQNGYSLEQGSKFQKKFVFNNPSDKNLFKLTTDTRIGLIEKKNNSNNSKEIASFSINSFDNIKCSYDETIKLNLTIGKEELTVTSEKVEDFSKLLDTSNNTYYLRLYVYVNMDENYKQYDYKLDLYRNLKPILLDQKAFQIQVSGENIPILIKKEELTITFNSLYVYVPFKRNNQNDNRPEFSVESYVYYSEQDNLSYNNIEKNKNNELNIPGVHSYNVLTGSETSLDKTLFGYIFGTCYYENNNEKYKTEEQLLSTFRLGRTREFALNEIKEGKKILIRGSNITYNFKDNGGDVNSKRDSLYFLQQQYSSLYRGMEEKLVFEFYKGEEEEIGLVEIKATENEGNKFHNFFYENSLIGFDIKDYNQSFDINKLESCNEIKIKYIVNDKTIIETSISKNYFNIITTLPVLSLRKKGIIINGQPNEQSEHAQVIYCDYGQNIVFRFYNENKTTYHQLSFSYNNPEGYLERDINVNLTSS